ncbi:DNA primase [Thorsellia anophelis]|uniref:DNA primase n=1 Tax=Thorsellia anophelis DSM 18579 TaxID=1123402 RepID=A0A1I0DDJ2_9GAMM|nr:DNA primase [Thorsellia anophelis]SET30380.1 DNA primase [Thorsellia anophelis DSM 18579]
MGGRIPRDFINDLLARVDIVDVIDTRVKLKKRGKNHVACCPFHQEKSPSFNVNQSKQFFHCFGCGESGNAIDFLMKHDRLEFVETIEELAASQGLDVPYENSTGNHRFERDKRVNLHGAMSEIALFYQSMLLQNIAKPAVSYLKSRGLSKSVVEAFGIGYAPKHALMNQFGKTADDKKRLLEMGMLGENDDKRTYERFRDRIMFPIRDKRGRVIGFGGRIIDSGTPKYLNSPETVLFQKSRHLYGLYEVFQYHPDPKYIVVVEGYMDVVALAQFGVNYAVATLGTATSTEHIQMLFRSVDTIICCYDGDRAGKDAAWRALNAALPLLDDGKQIQFSFLPDGEDPDSLIRKIGKEAFEELLLKSMGYDHFLFESLSKDIDLSNQQGKTKLSALAIPLIKSVPGAAHKLLLKNAFGTRIGMLDARQLDQLFNAYAAVDIKNTSKQASPLNTGSARTQLTQTGTLKNNAAQIANPTKLHNHFIKILFGTLIQNPWLAKHVPSTEGLEESVFPDLLLFKLLISLCHAHPDLTTGQLIMLASDSEFIEKYPQTLITIKNYAAWEHEIDDSLIEQTFLDSLSSLYDSMLNHRLETLIAKERVEGKLTIEERQEFIALMLALKKDK